MLIYEYEIFKCKPNERVTEMTNRIIDIITNLKKLGKIYSKTDINHKILRALPKKLWESRVTSIKEANDLSTLAYEFSKPTSTIRFLELFQRSFGNQRSHPLRKLMISHH